MQQKQHTHTAGLLAVQVGLRLCRVCRRWRHMVQHMFFISPWAAAPAMVHPLQLTTLVRVPCPPFLPNPCMAPARPPPLFSPPRTHPIGCSCAA